MSVRKQGYFLLLALSMSTATVWAEDGAQPFKLDASHTEVIPGQQAQVPSYGVPTYATPTMVPQPKPKKLKATVEHKEAPPRPQQPLQSQRPMPAMQPMMPVQQPQDNFLPPQFLGRWSVAGMQSGVEVMDWFQQKTGATPEKVRANFSPNNQQTWTIQGSPQQGYVMQSDTGATTPLMVQTQSANIAIIKYQHQVYNSVANEAIVMQLGPDGVQFDGLESITIQKPGEQPRFKVKYKLVGRRM